MNIQTPTSPAALLDTSTLTPSERLETLIEMVLSLHALESASSAAQAAFQDAIGTAFAFELGNLSDRAVDDECKRADEIRAHLKILAGDGTLDRCVRLLRSVCHDPQGSEGIEVDNRWISNAEITRSGFRYNAQKKSEGIDLFNIKDARNLARTMSRNHPQAKHTWRQVPRVCLPGYFVTRAIQAASLPLHLPGPEAIKTLEQRAEQLSGKTTAGGWWPRTQLRVIHWLLQEPGNGPEPTEPYHVQPQAWPDDDPVLSALRREILEPLEVGKTRVEGFETNVLRPTEDGSHVSPDQTAQEAHSRGPRPPTCSGQVDLSPLASPLAAGSPEATAAQ